MWGTLLKWALLAIAFAGLVWLLGSSMGPGPTIRAKDDLDKPDVKISRFKPEHKTGPAKGAVELGQLAVPVDTGYLSD